MPVVGPRASGPSASAASRAAAPIAQSQVALELASRHCLRVPKEERRSSRRTLDKRRLGGTLALLAIVWVPLFAPPGWPPSLMTFSLMLVVTLLLWLFVYWYRGVDKGPDITGARPEVPVAGAVSVARLPRVLPGPRLRSSTRERHAS